MLPYVLTAATLMYLLMCRWPWKHHGQNQSHWNGYGCSLWQFPETAHQHCSVAETHEQLAVGHRWHCMGVWGEVDPCVTQCQTHSRIPNNATKHHSDIPQIFTADTCKQTRQKMALMTAILQKQSLTWQTYNFNNTHKIAALCYCCHHHHHHVFVQWQKYKI